jgi:UDP-3-O-[3-hydroxymyristoyl] N-acetylglucosamine deacetylase
VAHKTGHALNNRLLRALFADAKNWRLAGSDLAERMSYAYVARAA